ncbi:MAG: diguanylate cyclase [Ectothiorhodospira sp.]
MNQEEIQRGHRLLIVEDSRAVARFLAERVETLSGIEPVLAGSLAEAEDRLAGKEGDFFLAVLDLNLPDAPNGEVVERVLAHGLPALVLTAGVSDDERDRLMDLGIVDYVNKGNLSEIEHVITTVGRIHRNRRIGVLVVDDSTSARAYLRTLLSRYGYRTLEARNGQEALDLLASGSGPIHLVLSDQHMPGMDGITLISRIRRHFSRTELCIIGMSNHGSGILSARQLKAGANDFITRPFLEEEFFVRVNQNVALIELIHEMRENANRDPLTRLHNRRYLAEAGETVYQAAQREGRGLAVILMDLDHFKEINDRFGHFGGDKVLVSTALCLLERVRRSDILVRYGGEEFCLLAQDVDEAGALALAEDLRSAVAALDLHLDGEPLTLTVSVGVRLDPGQGLEAMLGHADEALYRAKASGRNRVAVSSGA